MTRVVLAVMVAVGLGVGSCSFGAEPQAGDAQIEALVKDLSAETWKQRQAAQDKLVGYGEKAVPVLK